MEIQSRGEMRFLGIKVVGRRSELSHRVPLAWLELKAKLGEIANRVDPDLFYGLFPQADHLADTGDGVHRYWVGVEVSAFGPIPDGLASLSIPAQRYLTATAKGPVEAIEVAYSGLYGRLGEMGLRVDPEGYGFELYDQRRQAITPPYERFDYDIYLPLA